MSEVQRILRDKTMDDKHLAPLKFLVEKLLIKVYSKFLSQQIGERVHKTLGTIIIYSKIPIPPERDGGQ